MAKDNYKRDVIDTSAAKQLKAYVKRIENIQQEEADLRADKKEIYEEAKGSGFDAKLIRKVIRHRKQDPAKRQEEEALFDLYIDAVEGK